MREELDRGRLAWLGNDLENIKTWKGYSEQKKLKDHGLAEKKSDGKVEHARFHNI